MDTLSGLLYEYGEGAPDGPVLLLLHGTGGDTRDLLPIAHLLLPEAPTLAPQGPEREFGATRWFRRLAEGVFDEDDIRLRADQLAGFVIDARRRHALGDRPIVAVGFSNGANIGAATLQLRPDALREAALFSAMAPFAEPPHQDLHGTHVFISSGDRDPMAPRAAAERLVAQLRGAGAEVKEHRHPGGHTVTYEGVIAAREWLAARHPVEAG
jgi:phospholipase/carboxylesterase